ncbi:global transactivator [Fusarium phyllophilum]|uniref:Global transactivator n=1 Tax=Fusarium phyllophilum TaxID=47803 RepID=A0A8H5K2K2_9HYPO|nr:global transactivator [Fusarium phyllophilum]
MLTWSLLTFESEPDIIGLKIMMDKSDPGGEGNDHIDATANSDEEDSENQDDGDFDDEGIIAYLHDLIIAKHEAPRAGRIPGLKYSNTLFEHQKHAVGAAMRSLAGPLKDMILGDPPGLGKALAALVVAALSWEPGDRPSLIVASL